jgi:hypothetical protein
MARKRWNQTLLKNTCMVKTKIIDQLHTVGVWKDSHDQDSLENKDREEHAALHRCLWNF